MSLEEQKLTTEQKAKNKLAEISTKIDTIVSESIANSDPATVDYILTNFSKYLIYDLKRDFDSAREKKLKESPFDAIINDDLGLNDG
jgi:hypothetical protein